MTMAETAVIDSAIKGLAARFGGGFTVEGAGDLVGIVTEKSRLREALLFLKTEKGLSFTMLTDLFAVDRLGQAPRFEVVYLLNSLESNQRLVVKVRVEDGESVPTMSDIWGTADWLEREAYDMFGLKFEGHPDMRRILTVDDFEGHPLRKDFPTEGYGFDSPFVVDLEKG
jgi:NADH-quinone oxidoreductase subunit C